MGTTSIASRIMKLDSLMMLPSRNESIRTSDFWTTAVPRKQLDDFLLDHPDTPGARFVGKLQQHLYTATPNAEMIRMRACWRNRNTPLCFGGLANYLKAWKEPVFDAARMMDIKKAAKKADMEQQTLLPLTDVSVYNLVRYSNENQNVIPMLGTQAACLPLLLAGSVVSEKSVAVELGPFAGMSSKCIVTGMHPLNSSNAFVALDTFEGTSNYNAISRGAPWLRKSHPEFSPSNTSFLFLWKQAVLPAYPTARAIPGLIHKGTLNQTTIGNKRVDLISIDSAKSAKHLVDQTEGLGVLETGTIVFLMDFEYSKTQVKQMYGCLRPFLLPVYVSWNMEHWAFVVVRDISLHDNAQLGSCFAGITLNVEQEVTKRKSMLQDDLDFLCSGLTGEPLDLASDEFQDQRERLRQAMVSKLHDRPEEWNAIAQLY